MFWFGFVLFCVLRGFILCFGSWCFGCDLLGEILVGFGFEDLFVLFGFGCLCLFLVI